MVAVEKDWQAAEGDMDMEVGDAAAQSDLPVPRQPPKKDRSLFFHQGIDSLTIRKEQPAQEAKKEATKEEQDRRAQLLQELEDPTNSSFVIRRCSRKS